MTTFELKPLPEMLFRLGTHGHSILGVTFLLLRFFIVFKHKQSYTHLFTTNILQRICRHGDFFGLININTLNVLQMNCMHGRIYIILC
jgi:hypothetical protein